MVQVPMPGNVPLWGARSRTAFRLFTQWFGINTAPHTIAPINQAPSDDEVSATGEPGRIDLFEPGWV